MVRVISQLSNKKEYYERIKASAEEALRCSSVQGNVRIVNCRGKDAYYLCTEKGDTKGRYLRKHEIVIAKEIIQRDYNQKVLKCANAWLKWIDHTIRSMPPETISQILEKAKSRKSLILPYELTEDEYQKKWENVEYKGKEFEEGIPGIYTEKGERVRSKTEKMIADKLYMLNIPYRYEYPLNIAGRRIIYPDFTLLNVREKREYIWEHFGMMDNPKYAENAIRKIHDFTRNGYFAGENIIYTFETSQMPVDLIGISMMLKNLGFDI